MAGAHSLPGIGPSHLAWIRTLPCAVPGCHSKDVQAHHVRTQTGAGVALKPRDDWAVPMCSTHHAEGHRAGWRTFELRYALNLRKLAMELVRLSPTTSGLAKRRAEEFS